MPSGTAPTHAPLWGFAIENNQVVIDGRAISDIAAEARKTPFYIYSKRLIADRISALRGHLPSALKLHYAIKANPLPEIVAFISQQVDGLDVASLGEMDVALEAASAKAISFAGPGKSDDELEAAARCGVLINLESVGEARRLAAIAERLAVTPAVAIRVNPAFELKQSGMHMGGGAKPFGIDEEQVATAIGEIVSMGLDLRGFHIFAGSQILNEEVLLEAMDRTVDAVQRMADCVSMPIRHVNLGGGFGIPYFPGESRLDLPKVGAGLEPIMDRAKTALPKATFAVELGRFIVGEAGAYVTRVLDRKISRGETFLVTDGGLHHHLALSGNFGQVIRRNYPLAIANKGGLDAVETVDIVGRLCTPLDRLGDGVSLPRAEVGDLVVVFQSGAYGATASPINFLGHPPPAEIVV